MSSELEWLFGFGDMGQCGLIDVHGRVVVQLPGRDAKSTNVEVAPFHERELVGFFDRAGRIVHEPRFSAAFLSERIWCVSERHGKRWMDGFLSGEGQSLVPCVYDRAHPFTEGLAAVQKGKAWQYIDRQGNVVLQPKVEDAREFGEGLAPVKMTGRWGYIDKRGEVVIDPAYGDAEPFHDGVAVVGKPGKYGIINRNGEVIVKPSFIDMQSSSEGLLGAQKALDDKCGFLNTNGDWKIEPRFVRVRPFSEGLGMVVTKFQPAFIDREGREVIPPFRATAADGFIGGLARFDLGQRSFGYINKEGVIVRQPTKIA